MSNVMTRNFKSVFSLDKSKLSRLLNVIEERFKDLSDTMITSYEVSTSRGKTFSASNIDEILSHDNPIKNPIIDLSISYKDKAEDPENYCHINYEKDDDEIRVKVQAADAKKCNDLFAEIEEQVERSLIHSWVYSIKKQAPHELMVSIMLFFMIPFMLFVMFTALSGEQRAMSKNDFMSASDVEYFQNIAKSTDSQEKKMEFIYEYHLRKIDNLSGKGSIFGDTSLGDFINIKSFLIFIPLLVVIGGFYYIISKTYVGSVFLWGDYVDYHNALLYRRKFLWSTVVIALVVGILGNLFVFGFSQYL